MHAYQISEVRYQNFGPFEDVTFDFSQPGLTVIDGHIDGSFGCDSNGSGKSFLFDGVAWALFGRCLRERYTGDDIRRHEWSAAANRNVVPEGTATCVAVTLVCGDDTVSVTRYRKHPRYKDHARLSVNGEDCSRGTTPETTKAIEFTIGMDFGTFCNSVAFAAREDIKSFLSEGASDGERKKVLERILGLELYSAAAKVARGRLQAATAELDTLDTDRSRAMTRLAEKQQVLEDLHTPEDAADLALRITRARVSVRQLERVQETAADALERLKGERSDEHEKFQAREQAYFEVKKGYRKKTLALDKAASDARQEASALDGQCKAKQEQAQAIELLGGKACPTCRKTLTAAQASRIISTLNADMADLRALAIGRRKVADDADEQFELLEAPEAPEPSVESDTLSTEIDAAIERVRELRRRIDVENRGLVEMLAQQEQSTGHRTKVKKEIQAVQRELRAGEKTVAAKRLAAEMLEFWVEGFGNQGLKSFLIEAETPRINHTASQIAQRLLGPGARISLHATRQLKSRKERKEQLTIDAIIPGHTNNYAGASRAQKKRLDLALILAFREVVANRAVKGFRQLFADEIFDGMDESGIEAAGDLLRELAIDCPVAVISHHPAIKRIAQNYVTVYHSGNKATLRTGASQPSKKQVTRKRGQKRKAKRRRV